MSLAATAGRLRYAGHTRRRLSSSSLLPKATAPLAAAGCCTLQSAGCRSAGCTGPQGLSQRISQPCPRISQPLGRRLGLLLLAAKGLHGTPDADAPAAQHKEHDLQQGAAGTARWCFSLMCRREQHGGEAAEPVAWTSCLLLPPVPPVPLLLLHLLLLLLQEVVLEP